MRIDYDYTKKTGIDIWLTNHNFAWKPSGSKPPESLIGCWLLRATRFARRHDYWQNVLRTMASSILTARVIRAPLLWNWFIEPVDWSRSAALIWRISPFSLAGHWHV